MHTALHGRSSAPSCPRSVPPPCTRRPLPESPPPVLGGEGATLRVAPPLPGQVAAAPPRAANGLTTRRLDDRRLISLPTARSLRQRPGPPTQDPLRSREHDQGTNGHEWPRRSLVQEKCSLIERSKPRTNHHPNHLTRSLSQTRDGPSLEGRTVPPACEGQLDKVSRVRESGPVSGSARSGAAGAAFGHGYDRRRFTREDGYAGTRGPPGSRRASRAREALPVGGDVRRGGVSVWSPDRCHRSAPSR